MNGITSWLRTRGTHDSGKVGMVELFFDLVFVFAVTQLSHTLLARLDPLGAVQVGVMMVGTWWVWIYTSWVTNWLDPERLPVRLALFGLMGAGLVMSAAIPKAFGEAGLVFALAYAAQQIGRNVFVLWAVRGERQSLRRGFLRIMVWLSMASACWIAGGLAEPQQRLAWWALALAVETAAPLLFYWTPGLGRSVLSDWDIDPNHMAERCALFVIIALGESLLITGATVANTPWSAATLGGALAAFIGTLAMWWIYFDTGATRAHHHMAHSAQPGRQARNAYTYMHLLIVAGIVVCAVADELVLVHPDHAELPALFAILGGPAIYLAGTAAFKWATSTRRLPPFSHLVGLVLLALLAVPAALHWASALMLGAATTTVLVIVAAWEYVAVRRP
ncbi:MAG TPA: low temperature requirement protein A [Ideonella sp.]|uniref:low temperature requirement protein A n=1 Tax=Ideonella sp. TaxID=1929293 RepID=UPI002E3162A2|nr:low temperature requirement protein A [Ideonella sp.]HEX5683696.1 low temperature requirement protein A [Ideonella sp.]